MNMKASEYIHDAAWFMGGKTLCTARRSFRSFKYILLGYRNHWWRSLFRV